MAVIWLNQSDVTSDILDKHSGWCLEARWLSLWDQVLSPTTKWKTDTFTVTEACPHSFLILIPVGSFLEDFFISLLFLKYVLFPSHLCHLYLYPSPKRKETSTQINLLKEASRSRSQVGISPQRAPPRGSLGL